MNGKFALITALLLIGLILVSGCTTDSEYKQPEKVGNNAAAPAADNSPAATSGNETETQAPAVTIFDIGETSTDGVLKITVNSVEYKEAVGDNEYYKAEAKEDKTFAIVDMTLENTSADKTRSFSALTLASIFDGDGYEYDFDFMATSQLDNDLAGGEILPTRKVRGQLAFEVPKDVDTLELEIGFEVWGGSTAVYKLK